MTELYGGWNTKMLAMIPRSCHFAGTYDSSITYSYGDIVERNGDLYYFDGYNDIMIKDEKYYSSIKEKSEIEIITQCRNCGAPTYSDGSCPYCGTVNRKTKKFYI